MGIPIADGMPLEAAPEAAAQSYANGPDPGWQEALDAMYRDSSTTGWLERATEHGAYAGSTMLERGLHNMSVMQSPQSVQGFC